MKNFARMNATEKETAPVFGPKSVYNSTERQELNGLEFQNMTQYGLTLAVFTIYITPCDHMGQRTGEVETRQVLGCEIESKRGFIYWHGHFIFKDYTQAVWAALS